MRLKPLEKYPDESRLFSFDFSLQPELTATPPATLLNPSVTAAAPPSPAVSLTIGTPEIAGKSVHVQLSGGTIGVRYLVECTVHTDGGATLNGFGKLLILDKDQV